MNRRSSFWQRFLWIACILLGLAGCISPRPSPSPAPTPLPPSPPPHAALIHARAGIDEPLPPPPAPETGPFTIETLPLSPVELSPQERRRYFAPDTGLPVYEVKSFAIPERNIPEKPYYLVLPEETRRALVPGNPNASEEEVLSAFRNVDNEWVVLTVRAINGLFSGAYANRIRDNALLIPTFDKDGRRILMVMQPDDGCNMLALSCDLSQSDIYTNRVQIFWFEDGDVRRAVVGFPQVHDWYTDEIYPWATPIRYNPKDGKIYQLSVDGRFLEFSLFQNEEGKWRWKILPELTPYLVDERGVEDKRQEAVVEMEALGQATGFFGQGAWEEVERKTYPEDGVETVVYRVFEEEKTGDEGKSGYLLVQAKSPSGNEFYFLIITNSQNRDISPITTKYGQEKMVEYYARLVAYFPPEILEMVYRYGNAVGIYENTYEREKDIVGYDFDPVNPGSTNLGLPVVLFTQLRIGPKGESRDPQADFEARLKNKNYENDTLATLIIESWEIRSGVQFNPKIDRSIEDTRGLKIVDKDTYNLLMAIINGRHYPQPVMPPEEALITVFDTNPRVNVFLQQVAYWLGTINYAYPPPNLKKSLLDNAGGNLDYYSKTVGLGFHPPFSSTP